MTSSVLAALANGAIMAAVLTAAVWLALRWSRGSGLNAATRYAIWWAVLAVTLLLPAVYLGTPQPPLTRRPLALSPAVRSTLLDLPPANTLADAVEVSRQPLPAPIHVTAFSRPQWILGAWLMVSLLMLVRLAVSWVLLDRRRASAFRAGAMPQERTREWLAPCAGRRSGVRIASSTEVATPIAVGPRRPSILIPARLLSELDDADLGRILLHEAAHLARRDDYALLVQRAIEALFPFHPVVRWITRQIDLEREVACDDFVVEAGGQPRSYAFCLTRMVELCGGIRPSLAGATAVNDRSHLSMRVDRLLDATRHTGTGILRPRLVATLAVLVAAAWVAGRTPQLVAFAMPAAALQTSAPPAVPQPPVTKELVAEEAAPAAAPLVVPAPVEEPQTPALPAPQVATQIHPSQVLIQVEVTDPMNRFVTGLGAQNFRLFEDGVEQQISQVLTDDSPVSVGIVVDVAGSMGDKLDGMRAAVAEFLKTARPTDEFFLVQFNDTPVVSVHLTSDTEAIQSSLRNAQANGGTSLRDAIHVALDEMKLAHNPRKALLVLSKDTDNSSGRSGVDLQQELSASDAAVYSINVAGPPARPNLAVALGGEASTIATTSAEMQSTAARIAVSLRNRYVLAYTSTNTAVNGAFRKVQVQLVAPAGLPPLNVRFRAGYFAAQ